MTKQTLLIKIAKQLRLIGILVALSTLLISQGFTKAATVDELRAQSSSLTQQINSNNQRAKELATQADTLENQLAQLGLQISQLQTQIELTKTKIAQLQTDLDKAQAELDRQKALLKASLQALYKKGGVSTVELLIGSDSFSQFINDQTYLERLKAGIQDSTQKVIALKQQIQAQQVEQKTLLGQQQTQQTSLQSAKADQQSLLDQTKGQESAYRQMVTSLKQQQAQVLSQIAAQVHISSGDGSNGGYPTAWNNASQDSLLDDWGMFNRECVSYTAFKVAQSGRNMLPWGSTRWGNARDWLRSADADGIPYDRNPKVGDVAIATFYPYGHAMYVEAVNGRDVYVSQYNFSSPGRYSEMNISADNSSLGTLYFIHFP